MWTKEESLQAHNTWKASCGHHAIAAFLDIHLEQVRPHIPHEKGWMSPSNIGYTLKRLNLEYTLLRKHSTTLGEGINRIQFLGPWLKNRIESYYHTHWICVKNGKFLDTAICSWEWYNLDQWELLARYTAEPPNTGWFRTHLYQAAPNLI